MIRSLKRALQPAITDVSIEFLVPKEVEVMQSPQNLPPVFNGEKLVVYATLKIDKAIKEEVRECTAILKGNMLGAKLEHKVSFTLESSSTAPKMPVIHHLAAKALITDWETEEKEKKSIVDLSIASSVISSYTAFIAIDEESSKPVSGSMKTYDLQALEERNVYHCKRSTRVMRGGEIQLCRAPLGAVGGAPTNMKKKSAPKPLAKFSRKTTGDPPPRMPLVQSAVFAPCEAVPPSMKLTSTLEGLISAQQLNGSWELTTSFAQLVGKPLPELEAACPIGREGVGATVWATVLALSLLRSQYSSQQDEWELIAMKAELWLKKQSFSAGVTLEKLFQEAQKQL